MALYAYGEEDLVFAASAEKNGAYRCLDCHAPVKVRKGRDRFPHFYHLRAAPSCRLYSKSEDHLRAQLQLQKSFPEGMLEIERPFLQIGRIADLCWEQRKIVFEVQCSPLDTHEAATRTEDYKTAGYTVVWLLDDKRYNKRHLRPAEEFLRSGLCYFIQIRNECVYDQFEIFDSGIRLKKGPRMNIDLQKTLPPPSESLQREERHPKQILDLTRSVPLHFYGDRLDKAKLSFRISSWMVSLENWRFLELSLPKKRVHRHPLKKWLARWIGSPYLLLLNRAVNQFLK